MDRKYAGMETGGREGKETKTKREKGGEIREGKQFT